ncbi:MAG TPA: hypothetical protein VMT00_15185 [Thermoanaerobaculia bacterium]|nr:hypothetical protein [Thermoanaerobaculia bacterium]
MIDEDDVPRNLPQRTGIHLCIRCLREVGPDEYYGNDHVCFECAGAIERYPLASTPGGATGDPSSEIR